MPDLHPSRGDEVKKSLRGCRRGGSIVRDKLPGRGRCDGRHGGCRNRGEAGGDRRPCRCQAVQPFRPRWTFNRMRVVWRRGPRAGDRKPSQRRWAKFDRAYYRCNACNTGICPRDRAMNKTSLSPLPRAWSGSRPRSFTMASGIMKELAGLKIDPKMVERAAEALGTEIAEDERQRVEVEPPSGPTMYVGMDGTGVPARPREGRPGKQPDGSSKTREAKLVTVWTAEKQSEGTPAQGSAPSASKAPRPPTRNCRLSLNGSSAKHAVAASTTPSDAWSWEMERSGNIADELFPDATPCSMRNNTCGAGRRKSTVTEILRRHGRKSSATPLKTVRSTRSSRLSASTALQATWNGTARACSMQSSVRRVCLRRRRGRLQKNGRQPSETGAVDRSGRGRRTPVLHAQRALRGFLGTAGGITNLTYTLRVLSH